MNILKWKICAVNPKYPVIEISFIEYEIVLIVCLLIDVLLKNATVVKIKY